MGRGSFVLLRVGRVGIGICIAFFFYGLWAWMLEYTRPGADGRTGLLGLEYWKLYRIGSR